MSRTKGRKYRYIPQLEALEPRLVLDDTSAGYLGINARFLMSAPALENGRLLNGNGVGIGQVEPGRPPGITTLPWSRQGDRILHPDVDPGSLYYRRDPAPSDQYVDDHATGVAGVMIANGPRHQGVAPSANLRASAIGWAFRWNQQNATLLAAHPTSIGTVAVNYSYGLPLLTANGNSIVTRGLDRIAAGQDVVIVVSAENSDETRAAPPTDIYNGIVVGATDRLLDGDQVPYRQFSTTNMLPPSRDTANNRSLIQILAPGSTLWVPNILRGRPIYANKIGTSYAAPHVTAAVALLEQYAQIRQFDLWSDRHLLYKAVILNSADKVKDTGDGLLLGMEKTIVQSDGTTTWLQTRAYDYSSIPLDEQLGAGQLNVRRAINQLSSGPQPFEGEQNPGGNPVSPIGWITYSPRADTRTQTVNLGRLKANSYFSTTLTWDRPVGEDLSAQAVPDYDLELRTKDGFVVARSNSFQYNLEHIFAQLPEDGEYELLINRYGPFVDPGPKYALAWWGVRPDEAQPGRISGVGWDDANGDGQRQEGEELLANVRAYLYRDMHDPRVGTVGTYVGTALTGANGQYTFANLPAGDYYVSFVPLQYTNFTTKRAAGVPENLNSDADTNGYTDIITIGAGAQAVHDAIDAGMRGEGEVDGDVLFDGSPAQGVIVTLLTSAGSVVESVQSDSLGMYKFVGIEPGDYQVQFGRLPGTTWVTPTYGFSPVFQVDYGEITDMDAELTVFTNNHAPQGTDDTITLSGAANYIFSYADFGFTDPDDYPGNDFQAVEVTTLPSAGSLTNNGIPVNAGDFVSVADIDTGYLVFTPAANASGAPYTTFTFQVQDDGGTAGGGADTDPTPNTLTIDVTVNGAPSGTDNTVMTWVNYPYTLKAADFGYSTPTGLPWHGFQAVEVTTLPSAGTLTNNGIPVNAGDFVSAADIDTGYLVFTPAANASGAPYTTFTFQVQDDGGTAGGRVDTDPNPNTLTIDVIAASIGDRVWNDTNKNGIQDVGEAGIPGVEVELYTSLNNLLGTTTTDNNGYYRFAVLNPDDYYIKFTAPAGYGLSPQDQGSDDTVDSDADATGTSALFTLLAGAIKDDVDAGLYLNSAPIANDDFLTTSQDTALTFAAADLLSNDTDADVDQLGILSITSPANGILMDNGDGTYTYTPNPGVYGTDTLSYTATDGFGATATATVYITISSPPNEPPTAQDDQYSVIYDGGTDDFWVLTNDSDPDGNPLTLTVLSVMYGSAVVNDNGTPTDLADDFLVYTQPATNMGCDDINYQIDDGHGHTATAIVSVVFTNYDGGNGAPMAQDDSATTDADTPVTIDVLANDSGGAGPLTVTEVDGQSISVNQSVTLMSGATVTLNSDQTLTYTPAPGYNDADSFGYTISDGTSTASTMVSITINGGAGGNSAPEPQIDDISTTVDTPVTVAVLANDTDPDGDALFITQLDYQDVLPGDTVTLVSGATVQLNSDGTVTFTPAPGSSDPDSFSYTVSDGIDTASIINTISISGGDGGYNSPPVAADDFVSLNRTTATTFNIYPLLNDYDPDGDAIRLTCVMAMYGSAVLDDNGTTDPSDDFVVYTPPSVESTWTGDDISYEITDADGNTAYGTISVTFTDA